MSTIKNTINYNRNKALFHIPVNKDFIEQLAVSLALICHSSERGIVELLRDVFDYDISVGTVHNILSRHSQCATESEEQSRDGGTWGIRLLDLQNKGLQPCILKLLVS